MEANMEREYKIYKITEPDEKMKHIYIGFTIQSLEQRLRDHISHSRHKNYYLCNWIKKLLREGKRPKIELIKITNEKNWQQDEINEIKKWREAQNVTGVKVLNILNGGQTGRIGMPLSDETKKKISESNKRRKISQETRNKMSLIFSGKGNPFYKRVHTIESKKKMSDSHVGLKNALGHKLSLESKRKISISKRKWKDEELEKIKELLNKGYSIKKIVNLINVSEWAVRVVKYKKRVF